VDLKFVGTIGIHINFWRNTRSPYERLSDWRTEHELSHSSSLIVKWKEQCRAETSTVRARARFKVGIISWYSLAELQQVKEAEQSANEERKDWEGASSRTREHARVDENRKSSGKQLKQKHTEHRKSLVDVV